MPSAPSSSDFSLPSVPKLPELGLPSAPKLPEFGLPSAPKLPEFGLPSAPKLPDAGGLTLSAPDVPSAPSFDVWSAGGVPWGLFLFAFTVFPALVILGSKAMEMAGMSKPPAPPEP